MRTEPDWIGIKEERGGEVETESVDSYSGHALKRSREIREEEMKSRESLVCLFDIGPTTLDYVCIMKETIQ